MTSEHIKAAADAVVGEARSKEPDTNVNEAALFGMRMPSHIEDPRMRIRQYALDYTERKGNIGYGAFKDMNSKKTVANLT